MVLSRTIVGQILTQLTLQKWKMGTSQLCRSTKVFLNLRVACQGWGVGEQQQ